MIDDIVTRLRNNFATKDYPMLKDHCHCCAIPKEWGGHHDNCLYDQAADEIERLRADLDKASALISKLAELLVPFSSLMNKHEQGMLIKAVRGE